MTARAESELDRLVARIRPRLPVGPITATDLDDFLARLRPQLVSLVEQRLATRDAALTEPPDLWTPAKRTKANLAAMVLAADLAGRQRTLTDADRRVLGAYSGWGGLSIEAVAGQLPAGFPHPEPRGLIHEFYTPTKVCAEVARVVRPLLPALAGDDGKVLALEPSAGIGRFVRAFSGKGFEDVAWHAVEYSELSAAMLRALRPELDLFVGPFERWVAKQEGDVAGKLRLVVANPPYGQRSAAVTDDSNREYRYKNAYAYFLRRALDLLGVNGLGAFLIPAGFLTGTGKHQRELREAVLLRHHLSAAYRLPSGLFPGAMLVTDLLFFRSRGGALPAVDEADRFIVDGQYFRDHPGHVLGKEVGKDDGGDDQTAKPRWGYQVEGTFTSLPDLEERPLCAVCEVGPVVRPSRPKASAPDPTEMLGERVASAVALGRRVDTFLAAVAAQDSEEPSLAWDELHRALVDWTKANGVPSSDVALVRLAKTGTVGAQRFLAAFEPRSDRLIPALATRPKWTPRYQGRDGDVVAKAEFLYRQHRRLTRKELAPSDVAPLFEAGWCEDEPGELVPPDVYYAGHLWPKHDRARVRADKGDEQAVVQVRKLLEVIRPAVFDEIHGVSPRQGWVPLELVEGWVNEALNRYHGSVVLERRDGLVQAKDVAYAELEDGGGSLAPETVWCLGWMNHDKTLFQPPYNKKRDETLDQARLKKAHEWDQSFRAWCGADEGRRAKIEHAYQRAFQGYRTPEWSAEPFTVARWGKDGPKPHPHQWAGARRVLANRGGLVAYDVGVGKTYTGLVILAAARQQGWVKRPVLLVPNSIVWKWEADIRRVLPDYRVAVIGSKRKTIQRGARKGYETSDTDTPQERAAKWTRFQGGEYDVVLLTYTALARTKLNEKSVRAYADHTEAIQREVALRRRNAEKAAGSKRKDKMTERERAILAEGMAAWVAEQMELPEGWEYDPGITWDDVGIDLLIVDEAQNFKNLYLPEAREGGVPRFMGNAGEGSKRAWQLDFRCAAVRARTGGAGVVLLSATPAKNSPLEFYNLLQYVDHDAFARMGIRDPEQFIDRYCRIEMRSVVDTKMDVVERSAVTGFQNLHELRDVIFRYGEFKTAEQVGLKLPEPQVNRVEVDMDAAQEAKYARYVSQIENLLSKGGGTDKSAILGYLARMALVAIHADLDEGYSWKTAPGVSSPHSPKFDALAREVMKVPTCGHIVFCDNVAAHQWIRMVLEKAGVASERIAILNAEVAEAAADRQRIAREFNGSPDEGVLPKYDVVIANAIAYEGVDLQTRTCAIHHLDLPWEPATLQQRNGRGVRQGNKLATIAINYYFARRSQDGLRFNLIQGKRGWMVELLESQARDTNNPGAQMDLGPEEILLLISRDPQKTAARLAEVKARREAETRKRIAQEAASTLRGAITRFRKAEKVKDALEAARLRSEAEQRLEDLAHVDPSAWPWAKWAFAARDRNMLVPQDGQSPVYEGLRVATPNVYDPTVTEYAEFGQVRESQIGLRRVGSATWAGVGLDVVVGLNLKPEHEAQTWPEDDDARIERGVRDRLHSAAVWAALGWTWAPDAWVERAWSRFGADIVRALAKADQWTARSHAVPLLVEGRLQIGRGYALGSGRVVPPTRAGWTEFLERARHSDLNFGDVEQIARFWWDAKVPRDLLAGREGSSSEAA